MIPGVVSASDVAASSVAIQARTRVAVSIASFKGSLCLERQWMRPIKIPSFATFVHALYWLNSLISEWQSLAVLRSRLINVPTPKPQFLKLSTPTPL